jgi:hypothetical protein
MQNVTTPTTPRSDKHLSIPLAPKKPKAVKEKEKRERKERNEEMPKTIDEAIAMGHITTKRGSGHWKRVLEFD